MKIGGAPHLSTARAEPARHDVEAQRTPVSKSEIQGAISRALERAEGRKPNPKLVEVLTAQASLETAGGSSMYNFNFGGIKGAGTGGATATLRTKEVVDGQEITIRDGFRAYRSLDEGAADYVHTLKGRFGGALLPASRGDVAGFAHALKKAGYYTASEADYTRGLERLMGAHKQEFGAHAPVTLPSLASPGAPLTAASLERLERTLDTSFFSSLSSHSKSANTETSDDGEDLI